MNWINNPKCKTDMKQIKLEGTTIDEPVEIASAFNAFFTNVHADLAARIPRAHIPPTHVSSIPSFDLYPTTSKEILRCINSLKDNAAGWHFHLHFFIPCIFLNIMECWINLTRN